MAGCRSVASLRGANNAGSNPIGKIRIPDCHHRLKHTGLRSGFLFESSLLRIGNPARVVQLGFRAQRSMKAPAVDLLNLRISTASDAAPVSGEGAGLESGDLVA